MSRRASASGEQEPRTAPAERNGVTARDTRPALSTGEVAALVAALFNVRTPVMLKAAHTLRTMCKAQPGALGPHARSVLRAASACTDVRTRWNLIQIVGMLPLRGREKALAIDLLFESLRNESGFLRAFALTGLVNFTREDEALRRRVTSLVERALEDPSAAVRARARRLSKQLGSRRK